MSAAHMYARVLASPDSQMVTVRSFAEASASLTTTKLLFDIQRFALDT